MPGRFRQFALEGLHRPREPVVARNRLHLDFEARHFLQAELMDLLGCGAGGV
jgi:hypothetical protein